MTARRSEHALDAAARIDDRKDAGPDSGATATEYALMASLIAVVILGAVTVFGQAVLGLFAAVGPAL